jgi:hypothetical protein
MDEECQHQILDHILSRRVSTCDRLDLGCSGRFWPKAAPKNSYFLLVKTSALEKSGH